MIVKIEKRTNLKFTTSETSMDRKNESFKLQLVDPVLENLIKDIVNKCTLLIDKYFLPSEITFHLEYSAHVVGPDYSEEIPAGIVLSRQTPKENSVRIGMFDLENENTLRYVLAHEMGHMLPEWVSRKSGKTKKIDEVITFWSKPIYEGIADFSASYVTQNTSLGKLDDWYHRDILTYDYLEDARSQKLGMTEMCKKGFEQLGLIPKYKFYQNWIDTIDMYVQETGMKDPYSEGSWVAGQLWKMSDMGSNKKIWQALADLAYSGKDFSCSNEFITHVSQALDKAGFKKWIN